MPDLIISASAPQTGIAIAAAITTDLVAEIVAATTSRRW